jgi:hypothetical protein
MLLKLKYSNQKLNIIKLFAASKIKPLLKKLNSIEIVEVLLFFEFTKEEIFRRFIKRF